MLKDYKMTRQERFEAEKIAFNYIGNRCGSEREVKVAIEYFNNKRTLKEIGLMLGVSSARVSAIKYSLIRKCNHFLEKDNIIKDRIFGLEEICRNKEKVLQKIKEHKNGK